MKFPNDVVDPTVTISLGSGTGRGRSSNASDQLKIAQLAPIPTASDRTDTSVKAGFLTSMRQPCMMSCHSRSTHTRPQIVRLDSVIGCAPETV